MVTEKDKTGTVTTATVGVGTDVLPDAKEQERAEDIAEQDFQDRPSDRALIRKPRKGEGGTDFGYGATHPDTDNFGASTSEEVQAAEKLREKDAKTRAKSPEVPVMRKAEKGEGGADFGYGEKDPRSDF